MSKNRYVHGAVVIFRSFAFFVLGPPWDRFGEGLRLHFGRSEAYLGSLLGHLGLQDGPKMAPRPKFSRYLLISIFSLIFDRFGESQGARDDLGTAECARPVFLRRKR